MTVTGRITLTDDKLIVTENGIRTEQVVNRRAESEQLLAFYFNILP